MAWLVFLDRFVFNVPDQSLLAFLLLLPLSRLAGAFVVVRLNGTVLGSVPERRLHHISKATVLIRGWKWGASGQWLRLGSIRQSLPVGLLGGLSLWPSDFIFGSQRF